MVKYFSKRLSALSASYGQTPNMMFAVTISLQIFTEIIGLRRLVPIKRFQGHKVECISYIHSVATTILSYTINLLLKCTRICYSTLRYPTTAAYLCLHWQKNYAILIITLISLCAFKNSSGVTLTSSHCTLICF